MPVYNGAKYLRETIESVQQQTLTDWELIAVDDGSTDNSWDILQQMSQDDPRIKPHRLERNSGHRTASNRAFQLCTGRFVARTDQDDLSLPDRFARQVKYLEEHPEVGMVASGHYRLFPDGRTTEIHKVRSRIAVRWGLLFDSAYCHSTFMFRRELVDKGNVYRYAPSAYDYDISARVARESKIDAISDPLVMYRIHSQGLATTDKHNMTVAALAVSAREIRRLIRPTRLTREMFCALHRLCKLGTATEKDVEFIPCLRRLMLSFQIETGASDIEMRSLAKRVIAISIRSGSFSVIQAFFRLDPSAVSNALLQRGNREARKLVISAVRRLSRHPWLASKN